ncbi:MAG: alginate export family protein [Candidatus Riflebacteria bacterium]|nr:alginate export family protein [Candidatus Riflebacteria bacterium]
MGPGESEESIVPLAIGLSFGHVEKTIGGRPSVPRNSRVSIRLLTLRSLTASLMLLAWTATPAAASAERPASPGRLAASASAKKAGTAKKISFFEQPDLVLYRLSEQRWDRKLHDSFGLPDWVELSLTDRERLETVSHPWRRGQTPKTDAQVAKRLRLRLGFNRGPFWVLAEGQDSRLLLHDGGEFDGPSVEDHADLLQLFISARFANTFGSKLRTDVHLGRFTFEFGSTRLIGRNVYPNATNSFEGLHVNVGREKRWRARTFYTRPLERFVDGRDTSYAERTLWGTVYESSRNPWLLTELYYLGFDDHRDRRPAQGINFSTLGARVRRDVPRGSELKKLTGRGTVDYELEATAQDGRKGPKDFRARMVHAEVGYTWNVHLYPRLAVFLDYASGTKDPNGPVNQTFDKLYGLKDFDLGATGIYGLVNRANLVSPAWRVHCNPRANLRIYLRHAFRYLDEAKDSFSGANVTGFAAIRDATGRAGTYLGNDIELAAIWNVSDNFLVEGRYGHWWKGSYFDRLPRNSGLPAGGGADTDFFCASTQARF